MTLEAYPEDIEIKRTNFKTDQQEDAAETIADAWPEDVETIAEEGQHVEMFYRQVLDQFLGPAEEEMTFSEIESEHGSIEQWADDDGDGKADEDDVDVPDAEDIEPGAGDDTDGASESEGVDVDPDAIDADALGAAADAGTDEGVDAKRRAWFRAGFREGVEFAAEHPELFGEE